MDIYCVYLTSYFGNKLPQFYIGSSTIKRINSGYHGSISSKKYKEIYKQELKENPHFFKTKIISKYKTRKEAIEKEKYFQIMLNVVKSPMYFNESFATINGMFGRDVKGKLHPLFGKTHSKTTKEKISKNHSNVSGKFNPKAKIIIIEDILNNIKYECFGNFETKCKELNLPYGTLYKMLRNPSYFPEFGICTTYKVYYN